MTVAQAGSLESLGFEEIEPGCVEDSYANRKRVRLLDGDWQYEQVVDEDGVPNGLIRVYSPESVTARRESVYDRRKPILSDPEDMWSDYVGPDEYPLDAEVPFFIKERLARWKRQAREGIPESERDPFPIRCTTIRHDETRCWNWAANPQKVDRCKSHLGWVEQAQLKAAAYAKQRVVESTPLAVDRLAFLMENGETHAVQLKASTEILDRGGVRAGVEIDQRVEVELVDPSKEVQERLARLAEAHVRKAQIEAEARAAAAALEQDTVAGEVVANADERRALPSSGESSPES
jgi:hypothetical protein